MENVLKFDSGIQHIKVNNYGDEILLDTNNLGLFKRFAGLVEKADTYAERAQKESAQITEKYKDAAKDEVNVNEVLEQVQVVIDFSKSMMEELNNIFGQDFIRKVYRDNYALDEYFVPDELSISELIEALAPVMEKTYGQRIERHKNKYNASKRGKHTKSKEELIAEYREKRGAVE